MNILITFISSLLLFFYFYNEYSAGYSETMSTSQFVGMSLVYASIPMIMIALVVYFISHENRAKAWTHVAGTVMEVEERRFLFKRWLKVEYQYYVNDICHVNDVYSTRKEWCQLGFLMLNPAFKNGKPESWKGKRIKVFYNKSDYWDSVISRDMKLDTDMLLGPALNMIAIVLYVGYTLFIR